YLDPCVVRYSGRSPSPAAFFVLSPTVSLSRFTYCFSFVSCPVCALFPGTFPFRLPVHSCSVFWCIYVLFVCCIILRLLMHICSVCRCSHYPFADTFVICLLVQSFVHLVF